MHRKRDTNIKKGRQKGSSHNYDTRQRIQALLQMTFLTTKQGTVQKVNSDHRKTHPMVCMALEHQRKRMQARTTSFDQESYELLIDNCASRSITNDLKDFVRPPLPQKTKIEGFSSDSDATLMGTVKWNIEDDEGRIHEIILPNTYYSQHAKKRLLSPQHWAQQAGDDYHLKNGTWCATYANTIKLFWNQQRYTRTIPLSVRSNIGIMYSAPSLKKYCNACIHIEEDIKMVAMPTILETYTQYDDESQAVEGPNIISDSEEENAIRSNIT